MRLHALDSLRGFAAFLVVIHHCVIVYPAFYTVFWGGGTSVYELSEAWAALFTFFPVRLLWSGNEPVLFFFVLSGFVLTLPYAASRPPGYFVFIVKRICRLYLPFAAMILIAAALRIAIGHEDIPNLSAWFRDLSWSEDPTVGVVLRHLAMVGGNYTLDNVSWTLVVEWRVALVFPLLVLLVRFNAVLGLAVGLGFVALHVGAEELLGFKKFHTLAFIIYFNFGILLAVHRDRICAYLAAVAPAFRLALWMAVYLLFNARWLMPLSLTPIVDIANGFGAALLIALVLTSARAQNFLTLKPFLWLGSVSYSLYLVHVPVLMTMVHLLEAWLPLVLILCLVPFASLAASAVFHRSVEVPTMELGRWLARRIGRPPASSDGQPRAVETGQSA